MSENIYSYNKAIELIRESYEYQKQLERQRNERNRLKNIQKKEHRLTKKHIDKKELLSLNNIEVVRIESNLTYYLISMKGIRQDNYDRKVLLTINSSLEDYIRSINCDNYSIYNIADYMSKSMIEKYNKSLETGNYQECISILLLLEIMINSKNGYRTKAETKLRRIRKCISK